MPISTFGSKGFMFHWAPYPFLRFTPALIVGILLGIYLPPDLPYYTAGALLLAYGTLAIALPARQRYRFGSMVGSLGLATLAAVGILRVHQHHEGRDPQHLLYYDQDYSHYVATVNSVAEARTKSWRVTARLDYLLTRDSTGSLRIPSPRRAALLLYQPKADSLHLLKYGDRILVKGTLRLIAAPANPDAFDQQQYWAQQQIFHQHYLYLRADQWQRLGYDPPNRIIQLAYQLRQRSQSLLTEAMADREARGIALALVLGVKDQLDHRVREAYGRAGAMHVLAVSGLHIGIVYGVLAFLLLPLRRIRGGKGLHALLCVALLWLFALTTGGSVSVMRAATMFSCVILADATQRQSNIFNTLALSAFVLLLIDPYYILSVGFQLSYLAVLGIVYLQPRIYRWFSFRYWLADKVWALTAVSLAAQLATLPISLYYFHQFPTYFWLANLVVIPAASVILSLGLLTIGVGAVSPLLLSIMGEVLERVIRGVNVSIYALEHLPLSYVDHLYIDLPQVLALYGGIVAILTLGYYRRFRYLVYVCGCWLAFTTIRLQRHWSQSQQRAITFYHVKEQSSVDFTSGLTNYHWGPWNEQAAYQIEPHFLQAGFATTFLDSVPTTDAVPLVQRHGIALAVWQEKRIAFVREALPRLPKPSSKIPVDYLVVSNNSVRRLASLDRLFAYDSLIIDGSNSTYRARQLAAEADAQRISHHAVPTQGAFRVATHPEDSQ